MVEQELVALAAPVLPGGLRFNVAPPDVQTPFGVLTTVVSPAHNTLADGMTIGQTVLQIAIWDTSYISAVSAGKALSDAIEAAFADGLLAGVQRYRIGSYDKDTLLHGVIYEYSFWYHE